MQEIKEPTFISGATLTRHNMYYLYINFFKFKVEESD
jgi:hypothetical protein